MFYIFLSIILLLMWKILLRFITGINKLGDPVYKIIIFIIEYV